MYYPIIINKRSRWMPVVSVALVIVAVTAASFLSSRSASADSNTYPWGDATEVNLADMDWGYATCPASDTNCKALTMVKAGITYGVYDPWNYYLRNCTSYAAYRVNQEFNGVSVAGWGNASTWNTRATTAGYTVSTVPQVGDIVQWPNAAGGIGHVAYVYAVSNGVASFSECNHPADGTFTTARTVAANTNGVNFIHMGTPSGGGGGTTPTGRISFINNNNAPYAKDEIAPGGWHPLLGAGGQATDISASSTHLGIITGGTAWASDTSAASLTNNSPGFVPVNVPTTAGYPAGVKKLVVDKDGNMIAINNCSAAYGYRNISGAGNRQWVSMTSCGDAKDVDVGSGKFGLWSSCNGAYISDVAYGWTVARPCGDAKAIAIAESGRVLVIDGTNTALLYSGGWIGKGAYGDAQKIAFGKDRLMIIVNSGAAWASDIGTDPYAAMMRVTNVGDALAITVGANDRMGFISGSGAGWASDTKVTGGQWTSESSAGDTKKLVVG